MKKLKKNWPVISLFGLFFLFLIIQHHFVGLYHDDYGYLSLSYAVEGYASVHYGLSEILGYLGAHYFDWGGRVVGFFYEIFFGHMGLSVYWFFQSLAILGVFVFVYLIATETTNMRKPIMALFTIFSYGLFEIMQLRSGIYWMTASCLYIVPLCFFLAFVYMHLMEKKRTFSSSFGKWCYQGLEAILLFLGTYAQEQIAFGVLGYITIISAVHYFKTKKVCGEEVFFILVSLTAFLLLMLAPGNNIRMAHPTSAPFYELSFYGKFRQNIPAIVNGIFGDFYRYFTGAFFLIILVCAYQNLKEKKGQPLLNQLAFLICMIMGLGQLFLSGSYFGFLTSYFGDHLFLLSLLFLFHLLVMGYVVIVYLISKKEWTIFYLVIAAILSQGVMLVAPYYAGRCAIVFNIVCFIFMINVLCHLTLEKKVNLIYILIPFILLTTVNMRTIMIGYAENYKVYKENEMVLIHAREDIQKGEDVSSVLLKKLPNDLYASEMPYQEEFDYINDWIKIYYELPREVTILYE